jgi:hypothetical protein
MVDLKNLNNAPSQRSFDLIPAGTIVELQMTIRPGGVGEGGWEKQASTGSFGLDCDCIVVSPEEHAKRHIFWWLTTSGDKPSHADAANSTVGSLRAVLESAHNILPSDNSEAAQKARNIPDLGIFQNIRFLARLGVVPPSNGYDAKNRIMQVITPDMRQYRKIEQLPKGDPSSPSPAGGTPSPQNTPSAGVVTRPDWAKS